MENVTAKAHVLPDSVDSSVELAGEAFENWEGDELLRRHALPVARRFQLV